MKQLARRASLVVVLLLASVGTAFAECAWVLWEEDPRTFRLEHQEAYPMKSSCEAVIKKEIESARYLESAGSLARVTVVGEPSGKVSIMTRLLTGERQNWHYVCLPDTIDPRGPKGK